MSENTVTNHTSEVNGLTHAPISNDAPALGNGSAEIEDDVKNVGKADCDALYKECLKVQIQNAKYAEQLKRIRKVIRRIQKERRFLVKKLEGFGDNYQLAKLKYIEEEELKIQEALQQEDEDCEIKEPKKTSKKKIKVKRLQNAPKKPSNAFLMFCQKNRSVVQAQYTKQNMGEITRQEMTRRLAEIWKETSKENKKTYYEMYEIDKARYAQEMKDFQNRKSSSSQQTEEKEIKSEIPEGNLVINDTEMQ
uniref:non-histone protein 10-like n=1 Tax=Styela clava TaxID=7725 RepID=UPI00193A3139|nr:non-histone protein 10-like [Styela clava]